MDDLRERVEAVERALTDGDGDLTALADGAARAERVEALEDDVATLQEDVAELEAATQAIRGYVGNVRSANESVEQRADAAVAAVDSLEDRIDALAERSVPSEDATGATPPHEEARDRPADGRTTIQEPSGNNHHEHGSVVDDTGGPAPSTDPEQSAEVCRVCGRGRTAEAAADGGDRTEAQVAGSSATSGRPDPDVPRTGIDTTGRTVGGVDPTDESHRVHIGGNDDHRPPRPEDEGRHGRMPADEPSPGLLDRVKELV